ncbi:hypothetical protein DXG01_001291 [Tephrocybe rancida]|nr:hypothetical protein DXG01_001291 [Tephrocybe rancida]
MTNIIFIIFAALLLGNISGLCGSVLPARSLSDERRAADTCADPSLTVVYVEAYSHASSLHLLQRRAYYIAQNTAANTAWEIQEEAFRAWKDPQNFTFPLYQLYDAPAGDWVPVLSTTGSAPVVAGYSTEILGYAYSTPVCGSMPLVALAQTTIGDRYFTTDPDERDMLVTSFGWVNQGIVAYVLPVDLD